MSSANSSIILATVIPDKLTEVNRCFWDGHNISAADSMHSFVNSPTVNGIDVVAIFLINCN
jgi:hypothetical protein